jgi:hypothetical protein
MKKIVLLFVLVCFVSFAYADLYGCGDSYVIINGTWYTGSHSYVQPAGYIDGADLGSLEALSIGGEVQSWDMSGDYAKLGYMIDGGDPIYIDLPWNRQEGSNDLWQANPGSSVDISGLSDGVHTLAMWFWVHDDGLSTDVYDNNSNNNYVASFTTSGALPIELSSFTATALKGKVDLAWTTESETENSHFLVYRDGDVIGRVDGAGTSTEPHDYAFTDDKVLPGVHEYAIADVSYGGVEELHERVEVEVQAEVEAAAGFALEKAYPNPFNPRTAISYRLTTNSTIDMSIYSTGGEKVSTLFTGEQTAGRHQLIWDATGVPSGIYVVRMLAGDMVETMKVVLMK